jgi:hypothetical protein
MARAKKSALAGVFFFLFFSTIWMIVDSIVSEVMK